MFKNIVIRVHSALLELADSVYDLMKWWVIYLAGFFLTDLIFVSKYAPLVYSVIVFVLTGYSLGAAIYEVRNKKSRAE